MYIRKTPKSSEAIGSKSSDQLAERQRRWVLNDALLFGTPGTDDGVWFPSIFGAEFQIQLGPMFFFTYWTDLVTLTQQIQHSPFILYQ
jgi:hypothetical protein